MTDRDSWLAAAVVGLLDTPAVGSDEAGFDETAYAHGLTQRLAELLCPAEVAVLIYPDTRHQAVAAGSTERAAGLAFLEARGTAGPAADSCQTGRPARDEPLAGKVAQARWPEFAAAALGAGFWAVSTLAMRYRDKMVGAVVVLGASADAPAAPPGAATTSLAESLAEVAAVGLIQQRALAQTARTARQLQHALDSRVIIEQAKGALGARLGITPSEAFELLRRYARHTSRPLTAVADDAVNGTLPAWDLAAAPRRRGRRQRNARLSRPAAGYPVPAAGRRS